MPDYRKFYDKQYLGAWDMADANGNARDVTLTIKDCIGGAVNTPGSSKTDKRPIVSFERTDKKLVLNVTNGRTIAALYGNETNNWRGKRITFYATTTTKGRETVDCIRVRPKAPAPLAQGRTEAPPPQMSDDPPEQPIMGEPSAADASQEAVQT